MHIFTKIITANNTFANIRIGTTMSYIGLCEALFKTNSKSERRYQCGFNFLTIQRYLKYRFYENVFGTIVILYCRVNLFS